MNVEIIMEDTGPTSMAHPDFDPEIRREWLMKRRGILGGSDIGALFGASPFATPLSVYMDKIDETEPEDQPFDPDSPLIHGTFDEDVVANLFRWDTGLSTYPFKRMVRSTEAPIGGDIDYGLILPGHTVNEHGFSGALECTTAWHGSNDWEEGEAPAHKLYQLHTYLMLFDLPVGYVACRIGGRKFRHVMVERNTNLDDMILQTAHDFWTNHVEPHVPPEPSFDDDITRIKRGLALEGTSIDLPEDAAHWIREYDSASDDAKDAESRKKGAQKRLAIMQKGHDHGHLEVDGANRRVDFKLMARKEHTVKASTYAKVQVYGRKKD